MDIFEQLSRDEGNRLRVYTDTAGKLSVGTGRNLSDCGIREDERQLMLANDVHQAESDLTHACPWVVRIDVVRYYALVNMCFNLGIAKLLGFTNTLNKIQAGDYAGAADAMLNSLWAKQVGDRAKRLAEQVRLGIWQ